MEEIHDACHKRSNEGLGFSSDENFLRFIVPYIRRSYVLFERTEKSKESINIARSSLHTMMKTYVPEKVSQGDRNNLNRIRARANLVIHLIAAVVTFSVLKGENGGLYPEDPTGIRPDKIFASDATTVLMNQAMQVGETRVAKGTGKRMRQQGMGVSAPSNAAMVEHLRDVALAATQPPAHEAAQEAAQEATSPDGPLHFSRGQEELQPMTCPPGEREKQRAKTLGPVTIKLDHTQTARTGELICRVVSIKQKEVKGLVIYPFGDPKLHMYLLLHGDDVPDKEIALAKDRCCRFPAITEWNARIDSDAARYTAKPVNIADEQPGHRQPVPSHTTGKSLLMMDGCGGDIDAILASVYARDDAQVLAELDAAIDDTSNGVKGDDGDAYIILSAAPLPDGLMVLKTAASATAFQAAPDRGKQHCQIRAHAKKKPHHLMDGRDDSLVPGYGNYIWEVLREHIKDQLPRVTAI